MKKLLLLTLLTLATTLPLAAQTFTVDDFTYEVIEDNKVKVTGTSLEPNSDVVIPSTVSFEGAEYIVSELVSLSNVNYAGSVPYMSLFIPKSIESINDYFLYERMIMDSFDVSEDNQFFKSLDGNIYSKNGTIFIACPQNTTVLSIREGVKSIRPYAARGSSKLYCKVTLPNTLEYIGWYAFYNRTFSSINFPESLKEIETHAFADTNISTFSIGPNLKLLREYSFLNCPIEAIEVSQDNKYFSGYDGCVYSKNYEELILCPKLKTEIRFHPDVNVIGDYSCAYCNVERLRIPESIYQIGYSAFHQCINLKELYIPNSVQLIRSTAFYNCKGLNKIVLNEGLESIQDDAFTSTPLKSIVVPKSVCTMYEPSFGRNEYSALAIEKLELPIFILNPDTEIIDVYPNGCFNIYYASGNALQTLKENLPNMPNSKVYQLPEMVFAEPEAVIVGANSEIEWTCALSVQPACGVQFDMTLPAGLNIENVYSEDENIKVSFTKLANDDYRIIAYTADNSEITYEDKLNFIFSSDESLVRGKITIHDGLLSVFDSELTCQGQEILVTGYSVNPKLPESMIEGDAVALENPLEGAPEDVTFTWTTDNSSVATVENNSVLKAEQVGNVDVILNVVDPEFTKTYNYALEVLAALWGDVDGNESIDIADLVAMINYILERNPENFDTKLADIDRNGRINIVDVTSLVKIILSLNENTEAAYVPAMRRTVSFGSVITNGTEEMNIPLEIEAGSAYSAIQGEIILPEGLSLKKLSINGELGNHTVDYAMVSPTTACFIIYSTSLAELNTDETKTLINMTVKGTPNADDVISLTNAIGVDSECIPMKIDDTTIGFDEIVSLQGVIVCGSARVTDLSGRLVAEMSEAGKIDVAPGIYLVTYRDGHTTKVIVK